MLFAPGAPREHYFEGLAQLGELTDEERREWFDQERQPFRRVTESSGHAAPGHAADMRSRNPLA